MLLCQALHHHHHQQNIYGLKSMDAYIFTRWHKEVTSDSMTHTCDTKWRLTSTWSFWIRCHDWLCWHCWHHDVWVRILAFVSCGAYWSVDTIYHLSYDDIWSMCSLCKKNVIIKLCRPCRQESPKVRFWGLIYSTTNFIYTEYGDNSNMKRSVLVLVPKWL